MRHVNKIRETNGGQIKKQFIPLTLKILHFPCLIFDQIFELTSQDIEQERSWTRQKWNWNLHLIQLIKHPILQIQNIMFIYFLSIFSR